MSSLSGFLSSSMLVVDKLNVKSSWVRQSDLLIARGIVARECFE